MQASCSYNRNRRSSRPRRGIIAFFSVVLLSILALVSLAFFSSTSITLAQTSNQRAINDARMSAENGLAFMFHTLRHCTDISGAHRGSALFISLKYNLELALHNTPNLGSRVITVSPNNRILYVPSIYVGENRWFDAEMEHISYDVMRMTVIGYALNGSILTVSRKVSIDFMPQWEEALGYGIASMGPIEMGQNFKISGTRNPADGSLYSGVTSGTAVKFGNNGCSVSGSIDVSSSSALVQLNNTTVAGGVTKDAPKITLPEIDLDYYLNAVPKNSVTGLPEFTDITKNNPSAGTFTNVRVKANSNPSFANNTHIKGILYIEAPNKVTFGNNCTFTGIIVGQKAPAGTNLNNCSIDFGNGALSVGPASLLPNEYPFQEIRKLTNASVMAPDFSLTFWNNMGHEYGMVAVRGLTMKNNATATLKGSILVYGPEGASFNNNGTINVSLSVASPPPGFKGHGLPPLMPVSSTYTEW